MKPLCAAEVRGRQQRPVLSWSKGVSALALV